MGQIYLSTNEEMMEHKCILRFSDDAVSTTQNQSAGSWESKAFKSPWALNSLRATNTKVKHSRCF